MRAFIQAAALAVLIALSGCAPRPLTPFELIRARGELRVVTLNLPTCYYLGAQGPEGLEYELASAYAARLNVRLNMYPVADEHAMQAELAAGRADIAAASLTNSAEWSRAGIAAEPYAHVPQLVVYQRNGVRPRATLQLESARLAVRAGSPQERILKRLKATVAPTLAWEETAPSSADPIEDVDNGNAQYAISDAREFSFAHHLYPNVLVGFALPEERPAQWLVRRDEPQLLKDINAFFQQLRATGALAQLLEDSSGDTRPFAYEESRVFQAHLTERLPRYRAWFEQAAAKFGIDWRLLAAIGYQESKWDSHAVSDQGARGVMMLTADTAEAMGIKDRTNPQQSIFAGARYLAEVRAKVPERIAEPDRTWFTVAAYNVGFGHLEDARIITQSLGKDPDSWDEVRERLPLLAQPRWYVNAKRGYARGWEPVQFVDRIQRFLTLLSWQPGESGATPPQTSTAKAAPAVHNSTPQAGPAPAALPAPSAVAAPAAPTPRAPAGAAPAAPRAAGPGA